MYLIGLECQRVYANCFLINLQAFLISHVSHSPIINAYVTPILNTVGTCLTAPISVPFYARSDWLVSILDISSSLLSLDSIISHTSGKKLYALRLSLRASAYKDLISLNGNLHRPYH
jgi:hypothetical protein